MDNVKFLPGDVVLTKTKRWYGWLIRWGTQHTGEEKTCVNHAGTGENAVYYIEALWETVRTPWATLLYDPPDAREVWRHIGLTDDQRQAIAAEASSYVGRKYGWWKIGLHGIDGILGKVFCTDIYLFRRLSFSDRYPICSWETAFSYDRAIGYRFGVEPERATPDDIHDWVADHPEWMRVI